MPEYKLIDPGDHGFEVVHVVCWKTQEILKDAKDMERHYAKEECLARHDILPADRKDN